MKLLTTAEKLDRLVTEEELSRYVTDLLTLHRWTWYHTYDSRRSAPGFPDICAVKDGRVLFIELKRQVGKVTQAQQHWMGELMKNACVEVYLWRPSDMRTISERLAQ